MIAKKKYGQNFLQDKSVLDKIIKSMFNNNNIIVEIGPGLGDLTEKLLQKRDVIAFEVDTELYPILEDKFSDELNNNRLKLIKSDVLKYWEKNLVNEEYDLIANLPYYIATNIILKGLKDTNCKNILVMVQKEVAKKFTARIGEKEFSALGILTESVAKRELLFDISAKSFYPPPKVVSSMISINKITSLNDTDFEKFLRVAFRQPRKKLIKNLSLNYDKIILENIFNKLSISIMIRPHELATSNYQKLYNELKGFKLLRNT